MKKSIIIAIVMAIVSIGCKNKETDTTEAQSTETSSNLYACSMHPEITGEKGEKCSKCGMELTEPVASAGNARDQSHTAATEDQSQQGVAQSAFSMNGILSNYLALKNALTKDDANGAAAAGKALYAEFNTVDPNSVDAKNKKEYMDIAEDAKEHAEHIGDNANKIDHQREHFVTLSKDINDLVKLFGSGDQKLYQDFCPMANNGKGAIWISETKEIKNPYYGSAMLTCGSIKNEL